MTDLKGVRVVATSPGSHLSDALTTRGADVISLPIISFEPPESWADVDRAIGGVRDDVYEWVVFTSRVGVASFLGRCAELGEDPADLFRDVRVAAVGGTTAQAVTDRDIDVDLVPAKFTGADAAIALGAGSGRVLLPRPEVADEGLLEGLETFGWDPDPVVTYRTVGKTPPPDVKDRVVAREFDVVAFTSGSTVRHFVEFVGPASDLGLDGAGDKLVACIGPTTEGAARALGFEVDAVADPHTVEGLVDAIAAAVGR